MLPSELLRARFRKGEIKPAFLSQETENIRLAGDIIALFSNSLGKKKGYLNKALQELEEDVFDYKLIRGLALLLERRCIFKVDAFVEPVTARAAVFEQASKLGFSSRAIAITNAAKTLGVKPEELELSLFADIDEELIMDSFQTIEPEDLIRQYNLSLTQTLLFRCIRMEFSISQNWKRVFSAIKRNGLMYSVQKLESSFTVSIDGPLSIFRMTEKYGVSMAKLLPEILSSDQWRIQADILWRSKNRIMKFTINSDHSILFPKAAYSEDYDSSVEEKFADEFASYNTGWVMRREPEPLIAGEHVLIPDFSFERGNKKVYFEIVGFWTKEYIDNKIRKLKLLNISDIILAVDENLACSKIEELPYDIIYYKGEVPVKNVVERLRKVQEQMEYDEEMNLGQIDFNISGEIVDLKDLAKSLSVSIEALRRYVRRRQFDGYIEVGDCLLAKSKMQKIADSLKGVYKLSDALNVIESNGVMYPYDLLRLLGYRIKWAGLSVENSTIKLDSQAHL